MELAEKLTTTLDEKLTTAIREQMGVYRHPLIKYSVTRSYLLACGGQKIHTMVVTASTTFHEQVGFAIVLAISEVVPDAIIKTHIKNEEFVFSITWTEESQLAKAQDMYMRRQRQIEADGKFAQEVAAAEYALRFSAHLNGDAGGRGDAVAHSGGCGGAGVVAHGGAGRGDGGSGRDDSYAIAIADGIGRVLKKAFTAQDLRLENLKISRNKHVIYLTFEVSDEPDIMPITIAVTGIEPNAWVRYTSGDSRHKVIVSWPVPEIKKYLP
jgi:hypothetical protein